MGLFGKLKKQNNPTLKEDIIKAKDWIARALNSSGYKADFTIESLKEIDRFFDEQVYGLLDEDTGTKLFSIGCYIGEVLISKHGGCWIADDRDPQGEVNIAVKFHNGTMIWPARRAIKRYRSGEKYGIYEYAVFLDE